MKNDNTPWTPSFTWHAKTVGALLVVCAVIFAACCYLTSRLPQPYQIKHPAPQVTPWKGNVQENL